MFARTKLFEVYLDKATDKPMEDPILVQQGFSFLAFLLPPVWAILNQAWELLALIFLLLAGDFLISNYLAVPDTLMILIKLIVSAWIGYEACNFKSRALEEKNYILFDVVAANNETLAKQRFYDKYLLLKK